MQAGDFFPKKLPCLIVNLKAPEASYVPRRANNSQKAPGRS